MCHLKLISEDTSRVFSNERGVALVMVLWVLTLMTLIVTEFAYSMRVEALSVRNFKDEAKARQLARAGINFALAELMRDYTIIFLNKDGNTSFAKRQGGALTILPSRRTLEFAGGNIDYSITDESGKINLNTASREMIASILKNSGVTGADRDVIADSILDWRDEGHEYHLNGAEDDYYLSLPEPYGAKDGPFNTVDELMLVKGVTPTIFYGRDNLPAEYEVDSADSLEGYSGINRHFTVKGDAKINVNTAGETVLEAFLGKGRAQEILARRKAEGYYEQPVYDGVVTSNIFTIEAKGKVGNIESKILAIAERDPATKEVRVTFWREGL